jgi:hypothetical protein
MPFNLTSKDILITEIVSKAGQHGTVAESHCPHTAVLGKIDCHMGSYAHAAAVPDEHDFTAAVVGAMAEIASLYEGGVKSNVFTESGAFRFTRRLK